MQLPSKLGRHSVYNDEFFLLPLYAQTLLALTPNKVGHLVGIPIIPHGKKDLLETGTLLKNFSCFVDVLNYVLFRNKVLRGGPDTQKDPIIDRSFPARCKRQKQRFSLPNQTFQNSSKKERFLYGTKMSTVFLLLIYQSL